MFNKRVTRVLIALLSIVVMCWSIGSIVFDPQQRFFARYYTEENYKNLERLYNASQYRQKEPTALIADDVVFRYAAGAYMRGVDPILINSEITPLGKYMVGASFAFFQNDGPVILGSALLVLVAIWLLGILVFNDRVLALIPVAFFVTEELFLNQLRVSPLMDIIQLPWILLSIFFFQKERKTQRFFLTSLVLGVVMATKSVVPAIILFSSFSLLLILKRNRRTLWRFMSWVPLSVVVLMLSYVRTFLNGYTLADFLGFQKWILQYQQSKLIFPFSFWRLMLFNQWQTWWGEMKIMPAEDWRWTWPILSLLPLILTVVFIIQKKRLSETITLLLIWALIYEAFFSLGIIATRFLLPILPVLYILLIYSLQHVFSRTRRKI